MGPAVNSLLWEHHCHRFPVVFILHWHWTSFFCGKYGYCWRYKQETATQLFSKMEFGNRLSYLLHDTFLHVRAIIFKIWLSRQIGWVGSCVLDQHRWRFQYFILSFERWSVTSRREVHIIKGRLTGAAFADWISWSLHSSRKHAS